MGPIENKKPSLTPRSIETKLDTAKHDTAKQRKTRNQAWHREATSPDCMRLNRLRCAVRRWSQTSAAIKTATTAAAIISCRTVNRTRGIRITGSPAKPDF